MPRPRRSRDAPAVFREEGEYWTLAYEGTVARLRAAKGLQYIARLLERPGEDVHVIALAAAADPPGPQSEAEADVERARKAVGNRIHESLARIREHHDLLGRHLANAIRTGIVCRYDPERRIPWQVSTARGSRGRSTCPRPPA